MTMSDMDRILDEAFASAFRRVFKGGGDEVGRADSEVVGRGVEADGDSDARSCPVGGTTEEKCSD